MVMLENVKDLTKDKFNQLSLEQQNVIRMEEWAYSMGIQAYTFGLPLTIMERERKIRLDPDKIAAQKGIAPVAPINQIGHMHRLSTDKDILPYTPNNDTVYSGAFLELGAEPIILHVPDIYDRYWSVEVANAFLNNRFYIGTRATGGQGGNYAFIGPGWRGELPEGVIPKRFPYNSVLFALRINPIEHDRRLKNNPTDIQAPTKFANPIELEKVHLVQQQFSLTSLSNWKQGNFGVAAVPDNISKDTRPDYDGDLAYFQLIADLMIENPPAQEHKAAYEPFKYIGLVVGKKFNPDALDEPIKRGLARAAVMGDQIMQWKVKYRGTPYPTRWNNLREARYGFDYLDRAVGVLEGLFVHDYEEALYFSTYESFKGVDEGSVVKGTGEFFDCRQKYQIHFEPEQIPQTKEMGFWSITMYGPDFQLVTNDIDRFLINNSTPGLEYNDDGSLDIYIQQDQPSEEHQQRNWLPCPKYDSNHPNDTLFRLNYRIYLPTDYTLNHRDQFIPPVKKVS